MSVCVRVCVRASACVCVRARSCVCVCVCVCVALAVQYARRMRRTVMSSVACLGLQDFSTISQKWNDFRKNVLEHKMCVSICSTNSVRNISHSKKNSGRYYRKRT